MVEQPLPADNVIAVFVAVPIEIMCSAGEVHGECNCYFNFRCPQQEAYYSALPRKVTVYAERQQLAMSWVVAEANVFCRRNDCNSFFSWKEQPDTSGD